MIQLAMQGLGPGRSATSLSHGVGKADSDFARRRAPRRREMSRKKVGRKLIAGTPMVCGPKHGGGVKEIPEYYSREAMDGGHRGGSRGGIR